MKDRSRRILSFFAAFCIALTLSACDSKPAVSSTSTSATSPTSAPSQSTEASSTPQSSETDNTTESTGSPTEKTDESSAPETPDTASSEESPASSDTSQPQSSDESDNSHEPETESTTSETTATTPEENTTSETTATTPTPKPPAEPSPPFIITPVAKGETIYENKNAVIDASMSSDGYLIIKLKTAGDADYRVIIETGTAKYNCPLRYGEENVIALTNGNGEYTFTVIQKLSEGKAKSLLKETLNISIRDSFLPFLTPNRNCMYNASSECVKLASRLCGGCTELEKVEAIYKYVKDNIKYQKTAANNSPDYVPSPDKALSDGYGVCYDYASLMAAMLRSQKIPTKIVVGYAGDAYHAWISVYVNGKGWIDKIISFGNGWNRMDPTYAASAYDDADYKNLINFIMNNSNYNELFCY